MKYIISVTGQDKPGIIASITGEIFKSKGNLEDANMTILEGEFAMILLAEFKKESEFNRFLKNATLLEKRAHLKISTKKILRKLKRGEKHQKGSEPYIVSVMGRDRSGIVYETTKLMGNLGLNITDLNSKITGTGKKSIYALLLEVDVPKKPSIRKRLKRNLNGMAKKLRVETSINPLETSYF